MDSQTDCVNWWGLSQSSWWWQSQNYSLQSSLGRIRQEGRCRFLRLMVFVYMISSNCGIVCTLMRIRKFFGECWPSQTGTDGSSPFSLSHPLHGTPRHIWTIRDGLGQSVPVRTYTVTTRFVVNSDHIGEWSLRSPSHTGTDGPSPFSLSDPRQETPACVSTETVYQQGWLLVSQGPVGDAPGLKCNSNSNVLVCETR
jgi:hypothetical protein